MASNEAVTNGEKDSNLQIPPISIPNSFIDRFLWPPNHDVSQTDPSFLHEFFEDMVQEIQAAASYAFQNTIRKGKVANKTQSITLFCPYDGGHPVIDSTVKLIASHQGADVLVLDALELAAGEFGAIASSAITSMYNTAKKSKEKGQQCFDDPKTLRFFDALLTVRNSACSEQGLVKEPAARRIIYLRDFGSIARVAKLFLARILWSLERLARDCLPPTILIFGIAGGMKSITGTDNYDASKWLTSLRTCGQTLKAIMPQLDHSFPSLHGEPSCARLCPLTREYFLPLAYSSSDLQRYQLFEISGLSKADNRLVSDYIFSIFPKNAHSEEFSNSRQTSILERNEKINDALFRLSVSKRGGFVEGEISNAIFESNGNDKSRHHFQTSILSPPTADLIATNAIGLSNLGSVPSDPSKAVCVPFSQIINAYEMHLRSQQCRQEWIDNEKANGEALDDKKPNLNDKNAELNDEKAKDIVSQVMQSSDLSKHEKRLLTCIVKPEMLSLTFDEVCTDSTIVDALRQMVSLPLLCPKQFAEGILGRQGLGGVLLYGPPGTGKTILCRALAYECGAQMIILKPSDIHNKWIGESEKLASGVFSLARRLSPCVILVDEADTLFSSRSNSSKYRANLLTEFLQEMDGFSSATTNREKGVIVIGATNRPFDLDPAILRRLPRRIMVDLPQKNERKSILKIHLKGETLHDDLDLNELAEMTANYSGSDLKDLCMAAVLAAITEVIGNPDWASLRKKNTSVPTAENDNSDTPPIEKEGEKPSQSTFSGTGSRIITKAHFKHAFEEVSASFSEQAHANLYRWHKSYSPNAKGAKK